MPADKIQSIKSQIIQRLLDLCQPLVTDGNFRKVERKNTLFLLEEVTPAIHLVIGDETSKIEDERGYTCFFPVIFKLITADARDPYALADTSAAYLQQKIEADEQLNGLASKITYDGEMPFTNEQLKPEGGTVVMYIVEYRRMRKAPDQSY